MPRIRRGTGPTKTGESAEVGGVDSPSLASPHSAHSERSGGSYNVHLSADRISNPKCPALAICKCWPDTRKERHRSPRSLVEQRPDFGSFGRFHHHNYSGQERGE